MGGGRLSSRSGRPLPPGRGSPRVAGQCPFNLLPTSDFHPFGAFAAVDDRRHEPSSKPFHAAVATGGVTDDRFEIKSVKAVFDERARDLNRRSISAPIIGSQFQPKDGSADRL